MTPPAREPNGQTVRFFRACAAVTGGIIGLVTVSGMLFAAVSYFATRPIVDRLEALARSDSLLVSRTLDLAARTRMNREMLLDLAEMNLHPVGSPERFKVARKVRATYERVTREQGLGP